MYSSFLVALSVVASPALGQKPLSVLFVGNSYTYYNNLPQAFERVVSPQRPVITGMLTEGGMTLDGHLRGSKLKVMLQQRHWDDVVIQEQSGLASDFSVDGVTRVVDASNFWRSGHKIIALIRAAGAKPVLYMTWRRKRGTERDGVFIDYAYSELGREEHCLVAPVGRAWARTMATDPNVDLYYKDGSHPSELGTYIAAATLGRTIAKIDLRKLPKSIEYNQVDLESEKIAPSVSTETLSAAEVNEVASAVKWAVSRPSPHMPDSPQEPAVVRGDAVSLRDLAGSYAGWLRLYDVGGRPLNIQATLDDAGKGLFVLQLDHKDIFNGVCTASVADGVVTITVPKAPNVCTLYFRGGWHSGMMSGICESRHEASHQVTELGTYDYKEGELAGFGHWMLRKG